MSSAPPGRIGVFRALQLGDMLCVEPALRSLRAGYPTAHVTLVGLPWAQSFAERFSAYVDRFIPFPGHEAMPEQPVRPGEWGAYIEQVRAARFDLALQLHGSGRISNGLVQAWGAPRVAGFRPQDEPDPCRGAWLPWDEREHEVLRYVRLMRHLGLPQRGVGLTWPEQAADVAEPAVQGVLRDPQPFVVVHPGARLASRRWPVERFAAVAAALAGRGWRVVVTGGPQEAHLAGPVAAAAGVHGMNVAGHTTLGGLAALLRRAALVVCNDTGVSHVAAAVATPSVVVCSGADPGRWAPLDRRRHVVLHAVVACRPCVHEVCPVGHPCALGVAVAQVLAAAWSALASRPALQEAAS